MNQQATTVSSLALSAADALLVSALLKIAVDAQSGYATAAHDAKSAEHRNILSQYAHERQTQAAELEQLLRANGHATNMMGSVPGAFHQGGSICARSSPKGIGRFCKSVHAPMN